MSKIRRKVTVENSKTISDSSSSTTTSSTSNPAAPSRRPSVFERLGPSTGSNSHCRNWLKTGNCSYGNTCRYTHGTQPRGKGFSFSRRSTERPTGDLRERMKNKRQDVDPENLKRDLDEPASPTRDSSRGRHREKEDIKITKERTPASEEEPTEWETNREDSDIGDYDYELSLEMKRQKIQRELMKLEQENLEKREEIVIKKDETPTKTRTTSLPKVSNIWLYKLVTTFVLISSRATHGTHSEVVVCKMDSDLNLHLIWSHSKKKGPRTPSPPPPVPLDIPVMGKKHKGKHKNKEKSEEKQKEGKDRGRDTEKHKEKKEKRRSPSPPRHQRSPTPPRHHSPSSHSGSSAQRHSPSPPRRRRSSSPAYHRSNAAGASSPQSSRRSRSPPASHDASSPHRRSDRSSPSRHHSRGRERSRGDRERSPPAQERRHERRDGIFMFFSCICLVSFVVLFTTWSNEGDRREEQARAYMLFISQLKQ
uniref:Zinc finger CCCH-type containing 13 n=1 Tax=Seriola dumerili TaxID=41447 RepID=A0A3B4VH56_SERDU